MSHHLESEPAPSEDLGAPDKDKNTSVQSIPLASLDGGDSPASSTFDLQTEALRLDLVLAFLVLVFAGLLAAFPVRNSDFWMHLATGRRILAGEPNFGVDPYSYTTAGIYWANAAWGYDVFFYSLARLGGGADEAMAGYLIVGAKALLTALLALVLMLTRRRTESLWAPAICTVLALLAMSSRLILQPIIVSSLFLALTIFILQRPRHEDHSGGRRSASKIHWLLPVLFLVWVNVDEWFILGPATVALFLLGLCLQQYFAPLRTGEDAPEPGQLGKLALVLIVGLAACLINPYHFHAFVMPTQISSNLPIELIRTDNYLRLFHVSMFDTHAYWQSAGYVPMFASYILMGLGIVSFVLTFNQGWRWWRLLIWGAFFFLGVYQARLVVFLAVAMGPITALNLQDFARSRLGAAPRPGTLGKLWSIGGRLVSCMACLVLIVLTWPGWLHGSVLDDRHLHQVALKLEPDESVAGAARQLAAWQKSGAILADAHMFNWIPDLPAYFAWYQPGSEIGKGFLDYRFNLFPKNVFEDYLEIRGALKDSSENGATSRDLAELFRKHKIQYLALNWADPIGLELLLAIKEWSQWKLLFIQGNTVILQRVNPPGSSAPPPRLDPNAIAFASTTLTAPGAGPGRGPRLQEAWQLYADGPPARPQQTQSAFQFMAYYEGVRTQWPGPYVVAIEPTTWSSLAAVSACSPIVATGAAPLNLLFSSLRTLAVLTGMAPVELYTQGEEFGPPGALLLTIRYARQAIAADPDHFQAYNYLASAYNTISKAQEDRWAPIAPNQPAPPRQVLRRVQLTTILEQVLKVRPGDPTAHQLLMEIYSDRQMKFLDLAQEHRRFVAGRIVGAGPMNGETVEEYRKRIEAMQKELEKLDADLTKQRNAFELAAQNRPVFEKARLALNYGLGQLALELMLNSDLSRASEHEIRFVLELLLSQGRAEELDQVLREEFRRFLGITYDWYKAQAGAALGNYDEAHRALQNAADQLETAVMESALQSSMGQILHGDSLAVVNSQRSLVELRRQQADFLALAGMIALEQGITIEARADFEKALAATDHPNFYFANKPIAKRYLQLLDRAVTAK